MSVISFNFDCLLHEEFKNSNVYKPVYFDYVMPFSSIDPARKNYSQQNGIPLIKPHGSLDWAFNPETKEIKLLHWLIKPDTYYLNHDGIEPHIFLPHQIEDGSMQVLWDRAKKELTEADKITIIGYSFPDYDNGQVLKLFDQVDSKTDWEMIDYIENPNLQGGIRDKYPKLLPNININRIKFWFEGFQGYMGRNGGRTLPINSKLKRIIAKEGLILLGIIGLGLLLLWCGMAFRPTLEQIDQKLTYYQTHGTHGSLQFPNWVPSRELRDIGKFLLLWGYPIYLLLRFIIWSIGTLKRKESITS